MHERHLAPDAVTVYEALGDAGRVPPAVNITCSRGRTRHRATFPGVTRYEHRRRRCLLSHLVATSERGRVELARASAAPSIAGPIVVALLFAIAAGAMLPGAETFAGSHFQLNTALLLFLGYGWMFLLLWAVLGLSLLTTRSTFDARNPVPAAK